MELAALKLLSQNPDLAFDALIYSICGLTVSVCLAVLAVVVMDTVRE